LKRRHSRFTRSREIDSRPRIQRNQVHLAAQPAQQLRNFLRVFWFIVHASEQHIFESDPLPRAQWKIARRRNQHLQIPLFIQRHQPRAQRIVRSIQGNRQLRPDRLLAKIMDARHNPRCRHRHTPLRNADTLYEQQRRLHEILVIQERFAHPHKNQIDAILRRRDLLVFQHGTNLADNLARRQIALRTQQCRQARLAIHGATHLAGNANRRSANPARPLFRRRILNNRVLGGAALQRCD